jgi:hypothetical protein
MVWHSEVVGGLAETGPLAISPHNENGVTGEVGGRQRCGQKSFYETHRRLTSALPAIGSSVPNGGRVDDKSAVSKWAGPPAEVQREHHKFQRREDH